MPSLQETIAKNGPVVAGICIVVIVVAWWLILRPAGGPRAISSVYFYDVDGKTLYSVPPGKVPPIEAPSGGEGVAAAVFACGDCDSKDAQFIAYLEKYTDEFKQQLSQGDAAPQMIAKGHLIRSLENDQWVLRQSVQGERLFQSALNKCGERPLQTCNP